MYTKFNIDEAVVKFIPLVLEEAPKYDCFSVYKLMETMSLSNLKQKNLLAIVFKIHEGLLDNGYTRTFGSHKLILTDNSREQ